MEEHTWSLESAEARAQAAPASFFIPPREKREALTIGDEVKLLFHGRTQRGDGLVERMWVRVTSRNAGEYGGELLNEPTEIVDLQLGDSVLFGPEHVAAYAWTAEELGYDPDALAWARQETSVPEGPRPIRVSMRPPDLRGRDRDSGWILGNGDETDEELGDAQAFRWMDLGWLADLHPELEQVFRTGDGDWYWNPEADIYQRHA